MPWLIVLAIVAPLTGADGTESRDRRVGPSPCVAGTMSSDDAASIAQDPDVKCDDSEQALAAGEPMAQAELRPGLLAQRSVTYSPAWAGFGVAKAEEAVAFAEVDSEESDEANPRESNPRRERWKRFGIGVLHVLDFLAELYLELY